MTTLTVVNASDRFPKVLTLMEPTTSGYTLCAAQVDSRPPFLPSSRAMRALIYTCKRWFRELKMNPNVVSAMVFDAILYRIA